MSVTIFSVTEKSAAAKKHIQKGDVLHSINGNPINDVLDYDFYAADSRLTLELTSASGKARTVKIKKDEYDDLGLSFETYLIDTQHTCRNDCIFCFVNQMPPGMRESLYVKDDDDRLSFLFGNYVTLTNMPDAEIDRIIKMHISPINISVHTTNPELRCQMMKNRFAGDSLRHLHKLAKAGISINCQLVLCPGINDGKELDRTLHDLSALYPAVQTVACVPVGLTKFREGLPHLDTYTEETAGETIDRIEAFSTAFLKEHGCRLVFPADEFFILAKRPIPQSEYYEDFDQLDNGVGMIALQREEFFAALDELPESDHVRHVTIATGVAAQPFLKQLVDAAKKKWHNLECNVIAIRNDYFGHSITVAGLVTGTDLLAQLKGVDLGEELLLPNCMLRHEQDRFLDDVTLSEVCDHLNIRVRLVSNDGADVLAAIIGNEEDSGEA